MSHSGSPKAPDLEAQMVPCQSPDAMWEAGTPGSNSPSTTRRRASSARQSAAKVSPPTTVSAAGGGRPRQRPEAVGDAAGGFLLLQTRSQVRQGDAAPGGFERRADAPADRRRVVIEARKPRRASGGQRLDLAKRDRVMRADDHEMRQAQGPRGRRGPPGQRPRETGRAAPERRGPVGVKLRDGVEISVARSIGEDNFAFA